MAKNQSKEINKSFEMERLAPLFKSLNIHPEDPTPYVIALTHSSYNFDAKTSHNDYERLEFLGDSFIGYVVAELAFHLHPEFSQGDMTKLKSNLVQMAALRDLAKKYKLDTYLRIGNSLKNQNMDKMSHLLEDVFEALIGAMTVEQGNKTSYGIVKKIFYPYVKNFKFDVITDFKSKLQEDIQSSNRETVDYVVVSETGPSHDKMFEVEVKLDSIVLGRGKAKTKKEAEQLAAKDALSKRVN